MGEQQDDLPANWEELDAIGCFYLAVAEIAQRVKAGEPVPEFFRSRRGEGE